MPLPVCNSLWVGAALGPIERACLRSFVEAGYAVRLWTYGPVEGIPSGVDVCAAADVLAPAVAAPYRAAGALTVLANHFRYALQRAGLGLWVDCDVLCLAPLPDATCLFGWQDERRLNNAVLRLPADHPLVGDLLAMFETPRFVPPWARWRHRVRYALGYRFRPGFGIAHLRFGTTGPGALTHYVGSRGLTGLAVPKDVLYPVGLRDADALLDPRPGAVRRMLTPRSACIHLWHRALSEQTSPPPAGSFVRAVMDGAWRAALAADGA
ncbi:MAG: hypothetical protein JNM10_09540 [Planctomycetia bacterium]|nr:hypothetical protein [Planctomycetia bacterium]